MDFTVSNHGSIVLLTPVSEAAKTWADENLPQTAQMVGNAIVVEHHCIVDIVAGIRDDGLEVGFHRGDRINGNRPH